MSVQLIKVKEVWRRAQDRNHKTSDQVCTHCGNVKEDCVATKKEAKGD